MQNKKLNSENRLLDQNKYDLIRKLQDEIMNKTGFSPNFKTIINEAINQESMDMLTEKFVQKLCNVNP